MMNSGLEKPAAEGARRGEAKGSHEDTKKEAKDSDAKSQRAQRNAKGSHRPRRVAPGSVVLRAFVSSCELLAFRLSRFSPPPRLCGELPQFGIPMRPLRLCVEVFASFLRSFVSSCELLALPHRRLPASPRPRPPIQNSEFIIQNSPLYHPA